MREGEDQMTLRSRPAKVALIVVALVVVGLIVAVVAQPLPITIGGGAAGAGGAVNINAVVLIGQSGSNRYVAAGTSQGLRVYELRRVGSKYEVIDVTKD
jgi:hypothetical protein